MARQSSKRIAALAALLVGGVAAAGHAESRRIPEPEPGTPEGIVARALESAQESDEEAGFRAYLELVHPDRRGSKAERERLRTFTWPRFRAQASDYVLRGTRRGFRLARRDPPELDASVERVRLFLDPVRDPRRTHPTPIRLERHEGTWRITSNAL